MSLKTLHKYVTCFKIKPKCVDQLMLYLPIKRVTLNVYYDVNKNV